MALLCHKFLELVLTMERIPQRFSCFLMRFCSNTRSKFLEDPLEDPSLFIEESTMTKIKWRSELSRKCERQSFQGMTTLANKMNETHLLARCEAHLVSLYPHSNEGNSP
jgi:hypothetical protein